MKPQQGPPSKCICRVIVADDFEPDFALGRNPDQPNLCELSCEESSVEISLLDAEQPDNPPVQHPITLPLRFLNLHIFNSEYEDGVTKDVSEKAMIKCPIGRYCVAILVTYVRFFNIS